MRIQAAAAGALGNGCLGDAQRESIAFSPLLACRGFVLGEQMFSTWPLLGHCHWVIYWAWFVCRRLGRLLTS